MRYTITGFIVLLLLAALGYQAYQYFTAKPVCTAEIVRAYVYVRTGEFMDHDKAVATVIRGEAGMYVNEPLAIYSRQLTACLEPYRQEMDIAAERRDSR